VNDDDDDDAGSGEVLDHNDSHCRVCGSDADADKLLCCEACPFVFHLACLDPPLARVPRGTWICPVCWEVDALLDDTSGIISRCRAAPQPVQCGAVVVVVPYAAGQLAASIWNWLLVTCSCCWQQDRDMSRRPHTASVIWQTGSAHL
jgi:hypothetical protein